MQLGFHCNSQPVGGTQVSTEEGVPVTENTILAFRRIFSYVHVTLVLHSSDKI